jgi:hypothetical protein
MLRTPSPEPVSVSPSGGSLPIGTTVSVTIEEAQGLAPSNQASACNPYAIVCLIDGSGQEITGEVKQTKSKKGTGAPTWKETVVLGESFTAG